MISNTYLFVNYRILNSTNEIRKIDLSHNLSKSKDINYNESEEFFNELKINNINVSKLYLTFLY